MYLYDKWALYRNPATRTGKNTLGVYWAIWMIAIGVSPAPSLLFFLPLASFRMLTLPNSPQTFLVVGGCYGSVHGIMDAYAAAGGRPISCADNSNST
jgi:hypothetical protein